MRDVIAAMVERIVRVVDPAQVILFGSYARGETHPWSDVDLLVVIPDTRDQRPAWREINHALREFHVPHDVVVATVSEVRRLGNLVGAVLRPALREGKVLYDGRLGFGPSDVAPSRILEAGPVTEDEWQAETEEWLQKAREELRLAQLGLEAVPPTPSPVCYLAQHIAETALKGILVFLQIDYPLTHSLDEVRNTIPPGWRVKEEHPDLEVLSGWAIRARYPGRGEAPTLDDARAALAQARAVLESVLEDLQRHGFVAGDGP